MTQNDLIKILSQLFSRQKLTTNNSLSGLTRLGGRQGTVGSAMGKEHLQETLLKGKIMLLTDIS
jgi:hypothetical protein